MKLQRRALELAEQYHLAPTAAEAAKPSCPHPEKRRFKTREKALAELRLFWRTSDKGKPMPCRAYECRCGYWHTTKQPARNDDRGECL